MPRPKQAEAPLPLHVLTGFLGSGKTTLLNALLRGPAFADAAVLINEFGEVGIDHLLVREAREDLVVLASGCVCCTLRRDLVEQLQSLLEQRARGEVPKFSRLVLETTGLSDPAPIVQTLMKDPLLSEALYVDGIVCAVDAQFGRATLAKQPEAQKQVSIADRLIVTKVDLVEQATLTELLRALRTLNPTAPVRQSCMGEVDADFLRGVGHLDTRSVLQSRQPVAEAQPPAHDLGRVAALAVTLDAPIAFPSFALWVSMLTQLAGERLLRLKAVISVRGESHPIAVQAVQHVVYPTLELPAIKGLDGKSRIVLLTCGMSPAEQDELKASLLALAQEP